MIGFHAFGAPILLVNDLDLAKQIFIKDFDHFLDRRQFKMDHEYLDNMMTQLTGDAWKEMRSAVSPVFTSGKLKNMNKIIGKVAKDLVAHLEVVSATGEEVNARDLSSKFTMQSIASTGFGIETNAFEDSPQSVQFRKMARKLTRAETGKWDGLKLLFAFLFPSLNKVTKFELMDMVSLEFFANIIKQTIETRKDQKQKRNDMVDLLTETLMGDAEKDEQVKREIEEELEVAKPGRATAFKKDEMESVLIANLLLLFFAGGDTSSGMMAACICCLANNPDVQDRLLEEINEADYNEQMDYNTIMSMEYLDMVVNETMRHYPLAGEIERVCTKDYTIPGTNFTVPKGMLVQICTSGIMMDERYYPNPSEFNPENFSPKNKEKRNPYAFLVFGMGPRNCIGNRLALLQFKTGIVHMVRNFNIVATSRTPKELEVDPKSLNNDVKGGIWIRFKKRT